MNRFRLSAVSLALGLALTPPALAADGTTPDPQDAVKKGPSGQTQAPAEQPRLPANKEATSSPSVTTPKEATSSPSVTTPSVSGMSPDTSKPNAKKGAVKSDVARGQIDAKKGMKHPPTDAMDRATPDEKSTTNEMAKSGKNNPTTAMDRATPDQKSP